MSDIISANSIKTYLNHNIPVYYFDTLPSTNTYSKGLLDDFALVVSDCQLSGRGRLGRSFFSPKGSGIYMSLKAKIPSLYTMVPFVTTLSASAVCMAIEKICNVNSSIKWVNDIYIGTKKTAGILCEAAGSDSVIIGIGINFYPASFPKELRDIACSCRGTSLAERSELIGEITNNLLSLIARLPNADFMEYYKTRSIVLGRQLLCIQGETSFSATGADITPEGYLVVSTPEGTKTLSTGEVTIRFIN